MRLRLKVYQLPNSFDLVIQVIHQDESMRSKHEDEGFAFMGHDELHIGIASQHYPMVRGEWLHIRGDMPEGDNSYAHQLFANKSDQERWLKRLTNSVDKINGCSGGVHFEVLQ